MEARPLRLSVVLALPLLALACMGSCEPPECAHTDADGDGYNDCEEGFLWNRDVDCDDNDPSIHPDKFDDCDGIDEDCDGSVDEDELRRYWTDLDSDGFGAGNSESLCDHETNPTHVTRDGDCNDDDRRVYPGAPEVCDGVDNDCDGQSDEGLRHHYWLDQDGDGYGDGARLSECGTPPPEAVYLDGDCDDADPGAYPGAVELCDNGVDDDCDGRLDCEDGSCTLDCTELDCDDGLDDDGDGLSDCDDDDCLAVCAGGTELIVTGGQFTRAGVAWSDAISTSTLQVQSVEGRMRWQSGSCSWVLTSATFTDAGSPRRGAVDNGDCPVLVEPLLPTELHPHRWGIGVVPGTANWYMMPGPICAFGEPCEWTDSFTPGAWIEAP